MILQVRSVKSLVFAAVLALVASQAVPAAAPDLTTITVEDMHCAGCARKIAMKLVQVPGVATVATNVKASLAIVTPKTEQAPSPRAMWEAVESAGHRPTKLQGPAGTFTAKPQS